MPDDLGSALYQYMSPSRLAAQPPVSPQRTTKVSNGWTVLYSYLESRMSSLRNWRYSWWIYWAVLAKFFIPRRYVWLVVANKMWRGNPVNEAIIDFMGAACCPDRQERHVDWPPRRRRVRG